MEHKIVMFFSLIAPLVPFITAVLLLLIGYPLIRYGARVAQSFFNLRVGSHLGTLVGSVIYYGGLLILAATLLTTMGVNISALLGAAGVIGIAIGFAAQTTISNVISGIFLLLERPFSIGDEIECDSMAGTVEAIDPLSVKLRTRSNQLVRIPNEQLIKKSFINYSFYSTLRIDISVKVREIHVDTIRHTLIELAIDHPGVLADPAVRVFITQVTSLSTSLTVRCWVNRDDYSKVRRELIELFAQTLRHLHPNISIG